MVSRSDGGGADAAEGPDAAGLSDTFGYIFVLRNTFFVLAVCLRKLSQIFSNFLKIAFFLQIFAKKFRGARCGRSVGYIFSIGNFGGKKIISNFLKFSQIFSEYIFMYWQWRKIISNFLKFSQIFSKVFQFFQFFLKKCLYLSQVECSGGRAHIGGGMQGYMFSICCFWAHVKYISELCVVGLIRKCPCCSECFVLSSQEMIASDKHYQQFQVINTISIDKHHVRKHCEKTL